MIRRYQKRTVRLAFSMHFNSWFVALYLLTLPLHAGTNLWTGAGDGRLWSDGANWSLGTPVAAQDVAIASASAEVLLAAPTPEMASFTLSAGTLVCTNWTTCLRAAVVTLRDGIVTLPPAFTTEQMSNRVWIVCDEFRLESAGEIQGTGRGYLGGRADRKAGWGPGAGKNDGSNGTGAGHGGEGGGESNEAIGGAMYGDWLEAITPGSGGGYGSGLGGNGGGVVAIEARQSVTIDGDVCVDGAQGGSKGGGGSGGSIRIDAGTFGGQGRLSARGGNGVRYGGPGAGGRIAVRYDVEAQPAPPRVKFATRAGSEAVATTFAEDGTVFVAGIDVLDETVDGERFDGVRLRIGQTHRWDVASLTVSNASFTLANPGFRLQSSGNIVVGPQGSLGIGDLYPTSNYWLRGGGDLVVQEGGELMLHGLVTNALFDPSAGHLEVAQTLRIEPGARLAIASDRWLGGTPRLRAGTVEVASGGTIDADGLGFGGGDRWQNDGYGPGAGLHGGSQSGGGGYGGRGGDASSSGEQGGASYGLANAPQFPGSGSGYGTSGGARGGGLVQVETAREFALQGTITACGRGGTYKSGGGAGGGIFIRCARFDAGPQSFLLAEGGAGSRLSGSGGGGRIAIWEGLNGLDPVLLEKVRQAEPLPGFLEVHTNLTALASSVSVNSRAGQYDPGETGSFVFIRVFYPGTLLILR